MDVLKESAPFKKKFLRANQASYVTKELRIAIMKRSELKSKYLKVQTQKPFKGIIKINVILVSFQGNPGIR